MPFMSIGLPMTVLMRGACLYSPRMGHKDSTQYAGSKSQLPGNTKCKSQIMQCTTVRVCETGLTRKTFVKASSSHKIFIYSVTCRG